MRKVFIRYVYKNHFVCTLQENAIIFIYLLLWYMIYLNKKNKPEMVLLHLLIDFQSHFR